MPIGNLHTRRLYFTLWTQSLVCIVTCMHSSGTYQYVNKEYKQCALNSLRVSSCSQKGWTQLFTLDLWFHPCFLFCSFKLPMPLLTHINLARLHCPFTTSIMSSTQAVTGSDGSHPAVPVKLSNTEQQRVQQADAKLQGYVKQQQSKVCRCIFDEQMRCPL